MAKPEPETYVSPRLPCGPWRSPGSWQAIVSLIREEKFEDRVKSLQCSYEHICFTAAVYTFAPSFPASPESPLVPSDPISP